jgi:hypothetical protein
MRRLSAILFALTALAGMAVFTAAAGQPDPYKWCAVYAGRGGGNGTNCGFLTLDQCRAAVSGVGGSCEPNQFYTGPDERRAKRAHKQRDDY